ncbi:pyruvate formate lyase family protein [Clostridium magnum]|nr:pyruvate formate lyase family protein [Clostridium magnum]
MELRDGKSAEVGCTDRIKKMSVVLHRSRPNLEIHRTRVFTEHFKATECESQIRRRYFAMAKVYETMPIFFVEGERLIGWQGSRVRCNNFSIESHAHWLESDFDTFETRDFDPWVIDPEDKKELKDIHIPYWSDKTLTSKWKKQVPKADIMLASGYVDASNYISNPGSHFIPDYPQLLAIGYKGYYKKCEKILAELDESQPENVGKRDFYEGMMAVCLGIKQYGKNLKARALKEAELQSNPTRKQELIDAANRAERICWDTPTSFVDALHMIWLNTMLLNVEGSGPCINLGRIDQFLWPYLEKDLENGKLTVDETLEYMEEFNIKCCNIPWLLPANLAVFFGGYYRWTGGYCVGGYDANGNDAVNLLSYICLRAARETRTTAPSVHVHIGSKTSDSFLRECVKLAAEGLGHPSFFDIESIYKMIPYSATGLNGINNFTLKEIREKACTVGCVEPKLQGYCYGHTNANITNLGNTLSVTLNNGILPKGCPGYGAGTQIGYPTGDPRTFKTYDEFYDAILRQFKYQVDECHTHLLVAEKITAEEHQLPLFTMMATSAIEKGIDVCAGGAILNSGPHYMLSGVADIGDSLAAVKKLVYEDKVITMERLLEALEADFVGYEDVRQLCLNAPKYGNDIDYVDEITSKVLQDFAEYCSTKKCWRAGNYSDAGVQPTQANVAMGQMCWALPSGRKALAPLADTLSAEQHMDVNGPLAALRSYGKINHTACTNGTILNMWINKGELVEN